jgi:hypothetical protein
MTLTAKQKLKYYSNPELAKQLILQDAAKDEHIVFGAQASNAQLPSHLKKHTEDFDIFTKKSKKEAEEMEKKLDKAYGGDYFRVQPAKHKGTYKVKSNVTNRTVADYTSQGKKPRTKNILGVKYATLSSIKRKISKTLRDEKQEFRHDKDRETLQRIKLHEKTLDW